MDWKECNLEKLAKKVQLDIPLIKSLSETAEDKCKTARSIALTEVSSSSVIILLYDSLRERLEGLALLHGYKIYNHECYASFLSEVLHERELSHAFNRVRLIRNSINYYGKRLSLDDSREITKEIENLIQKVKEIKRL